MPSRSLLLALLLILPVSCGVTSQADDPAGPVEDASAFPSESTRIVHRFNDSSVPPEYHRSHTITIDSATTEIVIDSYGDEIGRDEVPTDPDAWATLLTDLPSALESLPDVDGPEDGCDGGTSIDFEVLVDDESRFRTSEYRCGGEGGEQAAAIDVLIAPLLTDLDPES